MGTASWNNGYTFYELPEEKAVTFQSMLACLNYLVHESEAEGFDVMSLILRETMERLEKAHCNMETTHASAHGIQDVVSFVNKVNSLSAEARHEFMALFGALKSIFIMRKTSEVTALL